MDDSLVGLLFDEEDSTQTIDYCAQTANKRRSEYSGDLYEESVLFMLALKLAKDPLNLRMYPTGKYKDPEDIIIRKPNAKNIISAQVKSAEYFSGSGVNKKGNCAGKKLDCWSFALRKNKATVYKNNNIDFMIFCTLYETKVSYSGIDASTTTPSLYSWIVPMDTVLKYWDKESAGTDYTINVYDKEFEFNYFQNYQLLVDACNG